MTDNNHPENAHNGQEPSEGIGFDDIRPEDIQWSESTPDTTPTLPTEDTTHLPPPPSQTGAPVGQPQDMVSLEGDVAPDIYGYDILSVRAASVNSPWILEERYVEPLDKEQGDGMIVGQLPNPGTPTPPGSLLMVDVTRKTSMLKKRVGFVVALAALAAGVAGGAIIGSSMSDGKNDVAIEEGVDLNVGALGDRIEILEAENAELSQLLNEKGEELDGLKEEDGDTIAFLQDELDAVSEERDAAVQENVDLQSNNDFLSAQVGEMMKELETLFPVEDMNGKTVAEARAYAEESGLELVLNSSDAEDTWVVTNQLPAAETTVGPDSVLYLTVEAPESNED